MTMTNWDHIEQMHRKQDAADAADRAGEGILSMEDAAGQLAEAAGQLAEAAGLLAEELWRDSPQAQIAAMEAAIAAFRAAEKWVADNKD
jgi:hypothetical protein